MPVRITEGPGSMSGGCNGFGGIKALRCEVNGITAAPKVQTEQLRSSEAHSGSLKARDQDYQRNPERILEQRRDPWELVGFSRPGTIYL